MQHALLTFTNPPPILFPHPPPSLSTPLPNPSPKKSLPDQFVLPNIFSDLWSSTGAQSTSQELYSKRIRSFLSQQLTMTNHSKAKGGIVCVSSHSMLGFGLDQAYTGFLWYSLSWLGPEFLMHLLLTCYGYNAFYSSLQLWLGQLLSYSEITFSVLSYDGFLKQLSRIFTFCFLLSCTFQPYISSFSLLRHFLLYIFISLDDYVYLYGFKQHLSLKMP